MKAETLGGAPQDWRCLAPRGFCEEQGVVKLDWKIGLGPKVLSIAPGPIPEPQRLLEAGTNEPAFSEVTKLLSCPLLPPYPGQGGAEGGRFLEWTSKVNRQGVR